MNKLLLTSSLFLLSMTAFANVTISSQKGGAYQSYELAVTGRDAKVLSTVFKENPHTGSLATGIQYLSCADQTLCTVKIGADVYSADYDLRNDELFRTNANSILNNGQAGAALTSPTAAYYLWKDTRKAHADNDKEIFGLLKKSKAAVEEKSELGLRLTLKSPNLNLSCIKLNEPIRFNYDLIDLGHMGGLGGMTMKIHHVCQLNVKVK